MLGAGSGDSGGHRRYPCPDVSTHQRGVAQGVQDSGEGGCRGTNQWEMTTWGEAKAERTEKMGGEGRGAEELKTPLSGDRNLGGEHEGTSYHWYKSDGFRFPRSSSRGYDKVQGVPMAVGR